MPSGQELDLMVYCLAPGTHTQRHQMYRFVINRHQQQLLSRHKRLFCVVDDQRCGWARWTQGDRWSVSCDGRLRCWWDCRRWCLLGRKLLIFVWNYTSKTKTNNTRTAMLYAQKQKLTQHVQKWLCIQLTYMLPGLCSTVTLNCWLGYIFETLRMLSSMLTINLRNHDQHDNYSEQSTMVLKAA